MAKYTSHYPSYGFYANGELKRFSNGQYTTDDKAEMAVLDGLTDVKKVDEPKAETKQTEAKPATKAPAKTTKASAK